MFQELKCGRLAGRLLPSLLAAFLIGSAACTDEDRMGPGAEADAASLPASAAAKAPSGIAFASWKLTPSQLGSVHTGIVGSVAPSALPGYLAQVRARGGRVLVKLRGGEGTYRNPNGTFNLAKWKSSVDKYRKVNISSYIADGTIIGNFVIDEPHFPSRWGNKTIPHATLEEAAKYSKQIWPTLPTVVNAPANWLAATSVTFTHLDAGWALYRASAHSSPSTWAANQVRHAKSKKLGLFAGLNVLDGGNGSSGFHGNLPRRWAMSAAELRKYGSALLAQSHMCGFAMWSYSSSYYGRADIKSAMAELSAKAKTHAKTSCRQ
jgi:hypothetical protein